jgi:AraC-like DNA-binding protein
VDAARRALILNTDDRPAIGEAIESSAVLVGGERSTLLAGVGSPCADLASLHRSYREALAAVSTAAFSRKQPAGEVLHFADLGGEGVSTFDLPQEREEELLNKVRMGSWARVRELLDELLERNAPVLSSSFVTMQCFFYTLLSTALKAADGTGIPIAELVDEPSIMSLRSATDLGDQLRAIFKRICDANEGQRAGHILRIRDELLRHVDERCLDPGISLRSIAAQFDVSVPYLSRFIKEHTGENFVEYVARRRIAKAKQLLENGTDTVEQVARRVGYLNTLTFRRAFRKYEGVNPVDFRGSTAGGTRRPSDPGMQKMN